MVASSDADKFAREYIMARTGGYNPAVLTHEEEVMNMSRVSKWMCCALLAVLVGGFGNRALGQGGGGAAPPLLDAKRMRLQPEEMVAPLKIFGDSSKEGF